MSTTNYDLIVLGGGRAAGLAVAAGKAGWKVALVERDPATPASDSVTPNDSAPREAEDCFQFLGEWGYSPLVS